MKKCFLCFSLILCVLIAAETGLAKVSSRASKGNLRMPQWSPDGASVALLHTRAGNTDVVVVDLKSGEGVNVSGTAGAERDLAWSPDGSVLLFSSQQGGNFDICAYTVEDQSVDCLTDTADDDFFPVWKPDATQVAFCRYKNGRNRVFTMDADGGNQAEFYSTYSCYPTWSPDGEKMAFAYNGDIMVVDIESGREKNITRALISGDWVEDTYPMWSPTKDRIVLLGRFEAYLTEIYSISSGGKKLARLSDNVYEDFFPSWSPDGKWVVYAAYVPNRRRTTEIFMSKQDASEKRRLTENWVFDINPAFSPDGEQVLFIRREGLRDELYVMTIGKKDEDIEERVLFPNGVRIIKTLKRKRRR